MRDDEPVAAGSEQPDERDNRIDAALRSYAEPPELTAPRVAVARIIKHVRAERPARRTGWWMWGLAGAAACLVAVMVAIWIMRAPRLPAIAKAPQAPGVVAVPNHAVSAKVAEVRVPAGRRAPHAAHSAPRREEASATPPPKLGVFPTPRPLSPAEQALVAFAQHGPPDVQRAILAEQKSWNDSIVADLQQRSPTGNQQDQ